MLGYIARRLVQMVGVVLISAVATYALLNLAPGGPMTGLRQQQQGRNRITAADIARIRAYYELDLYLPIRFSRWLIGQPRGNIVVGGVEWFADKPIGCRQPIEKNIRNDKGKIETKIVGCEEYVYLRDLEGRKVSRGILLGDFGASWKLLRDRPVSDLILSRLPNTIELIGLSTLLSLLLGIPLGIYSAVKQYSRFDYIFTSLAFLGSAMPTFFFGILMILVFSILPKSAGLPYLPPGSASAVREYVVPLIGTIQPDTVADRIMHLILPVITLTIVSVSSWSRFIRASMLEVLRQDYVRTARAKGLKEKLVILKHALRNALIPFVTIVVFSIPSLFGGAIITETIFSWPGMGRLYFLALGDSDFPVAMAILFITAVLTVVATLIRDLVYTMIDPRIRYS
ncbi:MAG TPA: ABC transporter permease [Anaerolineaceae bacterium]|jgi:peptide/nickel transport system permease protein|nr:ABC transporter permease [Anaerolineaceae bacterium]